MSQKLKQDQCAPCLNPGNPVFSCMLKTSASSDPKIHSFLYRTTSSEYGSRPPTFESSPGVYYPLSQSFSKHLGKCGMSRDTLFNTRLDRNRVCDSIILRNTI
ncbi:hypothetical protein C0J50_4883 [Silurus asotus]|uniref:Uncharacterized protein n=1 Tax=Silurus asotus TaxID=30991 RepID=A0AAD5A8M4_SILAS|nr:hypothetical protein C0J50_4883 [Silurus asotus]